MCHEVETPDATVVNGDLIQPGHHEKLPYGLCYKCDLQKNVGAGGGEGEDRM